MGFKKQVVAMVDETIEDAKKVVSYALQSVVEEAQTPVAQGGLMPVDTGFLRNSLRSAVNGAVVGDGVFAAAAILGKFEFGDVLHFKWTAEYAGYVHDGTERQTGRFFMSTALVNFPAHVVEAIRMVR